MTRQQYSERGHSEPPKRPMVIWQRQGRKLGEYLLVQDKPLTVGRDASSTIQIDSPYISKNHAVLAFRNGEWALEDLNSANGTRVNGNPIRIHFGLQPGDEIQVGDDVLQFVDAVARAEGAHAAAGPNKLLRLGLVAVVTGGALLAVLVLLTRSSAPSSPGSDPARKDGGGGVVPAPSGPVRLVDTALINQTLARAKRTGVGEADLLFDEGLLNLQSGRYRDAAQLFVAAQARRPNDPGIKSRLSDAQRALDQAIAEALAEADLAGRQLRFEDARLAWERILAMTYPGDPRNAQASENLRKLEDERRKRGGR
jgi:tetratricopeptide (TPR) repeat protein